LQISSRGSIDVAIRAACAERAYRVYRREREAQGERAADGSHAQRCWQAFRHSALALRSRVLDELEAPSR
jgi:hypothetical protein